MNSEDRCTYGLVKMMKANEVSPWYHPQIQIEEEKLVQIIKRLIKQGEPKHGGVGREKDACILIIQGAPGQK